MMERLSNLFIHQFPYALSCNQFVYDQKGNVVDCIFLELNPRFESTFEVNQKNLTGKSVNSFFKEMLLDCHDLYDGLRRFKKAEQKEVYFNQKKIWFHLDAFMIDKDVFAVILRDITKEKAILNEVVQKKKELEDARNNLDFVFNSTQDAMFMAEYKNDNFYYIFLNAAHEKVTGLRNNDIVGKTPIEVWGEDVGKNLNEFYLRPITQNKNLITEETLYTNGKLYNFLTSLSIAIASEHQYIIVSRKDITEYKELQQTHLATLNRLQAMFRDHNAKMLIIDPVTGKILDANPAACEFYGYEKWELLRMNIQEINMLPALETAKLRKSAFERKKEHFIFPHRLRNGEIRLVEVYSCPIGEREEPQLYSIIYDVTDRETYRKRLFHEKELLDTTLRSIGDGVITTDINGKITVLNKVAEKIVGWSSEEAGGMDFENVFILKNEETGEPVESPIKKVLETGKIIGLVNHTVLINKKGKRITIADSAAPIKNENGEIFGVVMVFRDIRLEKAQRNKIIFLSYHDALTGLYNRRFIEEEILRLDMDKSIPISVIMGDVNGLKITNDVFGHETGDELLKKVSEVFKETCGAHDIAARWGEMNSCCSSLIQISIMRRK
ncbi:PAS domain S-box protein [Aminipila terrae]|uniref:PAS domain S-box protein n=1 Tax=Aminipila terrae TaxID=2697030 RepID=UPI001FACC6D5|nr:PAS domain S-box protein [Aminipila terrae]